MFAKLMKVETSGWQCCYPKCARSPKYHYNIIGNCYQLKQDETCLIIAIDGNREIYCRDCIDLLYKELKPVLDSKLWIFQ